MLPAEAPSVAATPVTGDRVRLYGITYIVTDVRRGAGAPTYVRGLRLRDLGAELWLSADLLVWADDLKAWYVPGRVADPRAASLAGQMVAAHPAYRAGRDDLAVAEMVAR